MKTRSYVKYNTRSKQVPTFERYKKIKPSIQKNVKTPDLKTPDLKTIDLKTIDLKTFTKQTKLDKTSHFMSVDVNYWIEPVDFDDAHDCWIANKRWDGNGYIYICGKPLRTRKCQKATIDNIGLFGGCSDHFKWDESL